LSSSLLERPQGKVELKDEKDDTARTDEAETRDEDGAKPAAIFALPQNILSLATSSPDLKGPNHNFATGNIAKNDKNASDPLSALIKEAGPEGGEKQAGELPDAHVEPKKGQAPATPSSSARAEQFIAPDAPKATGGNPSENAADDLASPANADKGQTRQSGQTPDRADIQPQQPAPKSSVPGESKAPTTPSQGAARIADIQVVSERSFGTVKTLQIRLDPAELGAVTARIRVGSEGVEVHLVAEKTHAAETLAADRSMIEKALKVAGVADDAKISVTVSDRNAAGAVQQAQASQNAGQQQASGQQHGQQSGQQQAFSMQQGFDGRNGSETQAGLMGGEGRRNDESGQAGRERSDMQGAQDGGNGVVRNNDRNRGLVV